MPDSLDTRRPKLNPQRKSCRFKNIQISVDRARGTIGFAVPVLFDICNIDVICTDIGKRLAGNWAKQERRNILTNSDS